MECFFDLSEGFDVYVSLISETFTTKIIFFASWVAIIFPFSFPKISEKVFAKRFSKISNNTNNYLWNQNLPHCSGDSKVAFST